MVDVSVIIVNYNVKLFLEQTINSVLSSKNVNIEIIVVDNNSQDNSIDFIKDRFPKLHLIINESNVGFAKACNQGLELASGKYILFLNPDTIVEDDTISACLNFSNQDDKVGAVGVQMLDGAGQFLEESKRSFPSPLKALLKLSGISQLFPNSKRLSAYNLGHISPDANADIEVLCGAFMFIRKNILDKIGGFDESYFMYGEDIDLSYRIVKAGYKISYLGSKKIIHFKGQSTKKESMTYLNNFYSAMTIFASKHLAGQSSSLKLLLATGIAFRKFISIFRNWVGSILWIFLDGLLFASGLLVIKNWWASYMFSNPNYYEASPVLLNIAYYIFIWLFTLWILRAYKPYGSYRVFLYSIAIGLLAILIFYGLLPENMRTSRALILLGSLWVVGSGLVVRWIYNLSQNQNESLKRIGIIGSKSEASRVRSIIESDPNIKNQPEITVLNDNMSSIEFREHINFHRLNELIFCLADVKLNEVLMSMNQMGNHLRYKIIGDSSLNIIGSAGSNQHGESYGLDIAYNIDKSNNRYYKRMFDLIFSLVLILLWPIFLLFKKFRNNISFNSLIEVLTNKKTLVGYVGSPVSINLPELKPGVIPVSLHDSDQENMYQLNTSYALHYSLSKDVSILFYSII